MRENTYKMNIAYDKVSAKILKMSGDRSDWFNLPFILINKFWRLCALVKYQVVESLR